MTALSPGRARIWGVALASLATGSLLASGSGLVNRKVPPSGPSHTNRLPGMDLPFPPVLERTLRSYRPSWTRNDLTALLVISSGSCLTCMVELQRWNRLAQIDRLAVAGILVGVSPALADQIKSEERLVFPLLGDPDSTVVDALNLVPRGVVRILAVHARVAMVATGGDDGPIGFVEGVLALSGPGLKGR